MKALQIIEQLKYISALLLTDSGGATAPKPKNCYAAKAKLINEANQALLNGTITPAQFLDRVTYKDEQCDKYFEFDVPLNEFDEDTDDVDDVNDIEYDETEPPVLTTSAPPPSNQDRVCKVCIENLADVVIFPCGHVFFCEDYFIKWKNVDTTDYSFEMAFYHFVSLRTT